jgi:Spy/CpxP family protein refolding chaperone
LPLHSRLHPIRATVKIEALKGVGVKVNTKDMAGEECATVDSSKQIRESFAERNKPLREQLHAKRQELRQANEGGTFNEALATQKLTEMASLEAKLMGERSKLHQEMLSVLTAEQKAQLEQSRAQFKTRRGEMRKHDNQ